MPTLIDPSATVDATAVLADNVTIEANALVERGCRIGAGSVIGRHSIIWRNTVLGTNNRIFPFCSIGGEPQDKKYAGEETALIIGDNNIIREYCFINKATTVAGATHIGNNNWIMGYVHVAHDCQIGNHTTIANSVQIAGHVHIDDYATLGGGTLFHQFRRVGQGAIIGGGEKMRTDTPPYALVAEGTVAVNVEGMRRQGFSERARANMRQAYRLLYRTDLSLLVATEQITALADTDPPLQTLVDFLCLPDLRLIRPRQRHEP